MKKIIGIIASAAVLTLGCVVEPESSVDTTTTTTESTSTTTTTSTTVSTTIPSNPTGTFTLNGRTIIDPDGEVFIPMGANGAVRQGIFEYGYTFNWNGTLTDRSDAVLQWGWNTVRATLKCIPPSDGPTPTQVNQGLDTLIAEYTAKKIVVIVECHDLTGQDPDIAHAKPVTDFIVGVAQRHANNPYVWVNPYNEPYASNTYAGWLAIHNDALARVRAVAPTKMFVADIPGWGQAWEMLVDGHPIVNFAKDDGRVLLGWHAWGAVGSNADRADQARATERHREVFEAIKAGEVPVVIGEFGDPLTLNEGTAGLPIWNRTGAYAVMELAPQYGVGLIWWHATGDSSVFLTYSLMQNRQSPPWNALPNGTGLSAAGKVFWDLTH